MGSSAIALDSFCHRQFDDDQYGGTKITVSKEEFMKRVLKYYNERQQVYEEYKDRPVLIDGYAPFCKHIFMPNFEDEDDIKDGAIEITKENEHLLKTKYEARKENELPVLTRYFKKEDVDTPTSQYLDLICKLLHVKWNRCIEMEELD